MAAKKPAAPKPSKTKRIVTHPATPAGAGVSLLSIVPLLPASWQPYAAGVAALLGVVAPLLAARQQQRSAT